MAGFFGLIAVAVIRRHALPRVRKESWGRSVGWWVGCVYPGDSKRYTPEKLTWIPKMAHFSREFTFSIP